MNLAKIEDLRNLLDDKRSVGLIKKYFEFHNIKICTRFINLIGFEDLLIDFCKENNWNPNDTLVVYEMPYDNPNGDLNIAHKYNQLYGNIIPKSNYTECLCFFYPNMTLERLAKQIDQIVNMKAFL